MISTQSASTTAPSISTQSASITTPSISSQSATTTTQSASTTTQSASASTLLASTTKKPADQSENLVKSDIQNSMSTTSTPLITTNHDKLVSVSSASSTPSTVITTLSKFCFGHYI